MDRLCRNMLSSSWRTNGLFSGQHAREIRCQRPFSATVCLRAAKPPDARPKASKATPASVIKKNHPVYKRYIAPKHTPVSQSKTPKAVANPLRYRTIPLFFGCLLALGISGYVAFLYVVVTRDDGEIVRSTPSTQQDVSAQYNKIANSFDDTVASTENMMGITSLRRKLASEAKGDVLEVSIGTGRNLEFYDWDFKGYQGVENVDWKSFVKERKVRSFTAVDKSGEMLEIAHEKFGKMFPGIVGVRWIIADAADEGAIPGPPKSANERSGNLDAKYDTVVQTMGLCSVSDPVKLLKNLGQRVKEEEGRILLLEHGRGKWEWLNKYLDKSAESHAKAFGCWWNRDIREIVEESGLEVVKIEQPMWWHGGTTWWVELKKPKEPFVEESGSLNKP
ncbi:ubiquinone/menaquinone biosynthesis-related protein [Diplocarpon rosae]|nr:ubiquinone/menaquinone biosynthesis-related protein [Diplocarpon rosae]